MSLARYSVQVFEYHGHVLRSSVYRMYYVVKEELRYPVVGIHYPETFQDLDERFSSDDVSLDYIAKLQC